MKNKQLAIAIPTYNRSEILHENLIYMLPDIRMHNIPIYISDDSTDTKTEQMVNALKKEYPYIYYFKNDPGLGHDENCFFTLQLPTEEYVWYLGDSLSITHGAINQILALTKAATYDFISVNSENRNLNITTKHYTDPNEVFRDLAWHLTLTGATIYHTTVLTSLTNLKRANYKNFPQTLILFNQLLSSQYGLYWIEEELIFPNKNRISYWGKKPFEVFVNDWSKFILDLPEKYSIEDKRYVIKSHDKHTHLFNAKHLLIYRLQGTFSLKIFIKYFQAIQLSINLNIFFIFLIASFPIPMKNRIKEYLKIQ